MRPMNLLDPGRIPTVYTTVHFRDGHLEPISESYKVVGEDTVCFECESGIYKFKSILRDLPNGMRMKCHYLYKWRTDLMIWLTTDEVANISTQDIEKISNNIEESSYE